MIEYNKEKSLFYIEGKNISYVLYVTEFGYLFTTYFGKKINRDDDYLVKYARRYMFFGHSSNYEHEINMCPVEYSLFGRLDFHEPTVIVKRSDGARMSRFSYVSHEIIKGSPEIIGMPHARYGGETLSIKLKDDFSNVYLYANYTIFEDSDVIVKNFVIENKEEDEVVIERAYSYCVSLPNNNYDLIKLTGSWGRERNIDRNPLSRGVNKIHSYEGKSSAEYNPYMALCEKRTNEREGDVFALSLIYSGNYSMVAELDSYDNIRLQGGISELSFSWTLEKNEKFVTPQVAMTYGYGLGESSRNIADFYRNHIINKKWNEMPHPVVVNHWEATEMNYTEKEIIPIIEEAKQYGIDTFVLDDGWFGERWDDTRGLGDWFVNEEKLHGGLKVIVDKCKENGLKFGLWFEPEMICENSHLFREHPEFALIKKGVEPARWRNQLCLDFSNTKIIDYIFEQMKKILDNNDISYIKWDMNRNVSEYYSATLPPSRQGELGHRYTLGVYYLYEKLLKAYPDIFIEGCSGGGARFDGGIFYYSPQIWTSDNTDAKERTFIQYGTSFFAPLSAMSCHVSACPNCHTGRVTPLNTRYAVASLGSFGYELDITKLTNEEKEKVKEQVKHYRSIESLIRNGDLYRIMSPFETDYFACLILNKEKTRGYLSITKTSSHFDDIFDPIKLDGLKDDSIYCLSQLDIRASGRTLKEVGLFLRPLREYDSLIVDINEE